MTHGCFLRPSPRRATGGITSAPGSAASSPEPLSFTVHSQPDPRALGEPQQRAGRLRMLLVLTVLACAVAWGIGRQWWRQLRATVTQGDAAKQAVAVQASTPGAPASDARPTEVANAAFGFTQDALTGLASRLQLEDRLDAAALRAEAQQRRLALLYIDLDGFKPINESYGYEAGDSLLRDVAHRLAGLGRSTDTLARLGGDQFLMLMDGDPDHASAALVADRIRQVLQRPYVLQGREVHLSCSIGIVLYPDHGPRARLLTRADAAMLAAKRAGGNVHCFICKCCCNINACREWPHIGCLDTSERDCHIFLTYHSNKEFEFG